MGSKRNAIGAGGWAVGPGCPSGWLRRFVYRSYAALRRLSSCRTVHAHIRRVGIAILSLVGVQRAMEKALPSPHHNGVIPWHGRTNLVSHKGFVVGLFNIL